MLIWGFIQYWWHQRMVKRYGNTCRYCLERRYKDKYPS